MQAPRVMFSTVFSLLIVSAIILPVVAVNYSPGVTVGQYVKYGNFIGSGQGFESFNEISFEQFQVAAVSGTVVTLLSTGQYKNGTALPGNGTSQVWDVAAGTLNGTPDVQGPIIATDLNHGDAIPPPNTYTVNSTEQRSYLAVNREVNLLTLTISTSDYNSTLSYVYDKQTGMLLEASSLTITQSQPEPVTSGYSYSMIETNIFNPTTGGIDQLMQYIAAALTVIIVVAIVVFLINRKRV